CDPFGQGRTEGDEGPVGRTTRLAPTLLGIEPSVGVLAIAAGDTIDRDLGVALQELEKLAAARPNAVQCIRREVDAFALPCHAPEIGQGEIGTRGKAERHRDSPEQSSLLSDHGAGPLTIATAC